VRKLTKHDKRNTRKGENAFTGNECMRFSKSKAVAGTRIDEFIARAFEM